MIEIGPNLSELLTTIIFASIVYAITFLFKSPSKKAVVPVKEDKPLHHANYVQIIKSEALSTTLILN